MDRNYPHAISSQLNLRPGQVAQAISLFDEGNTIPFVARYRKEATGGLDEEQLRGIAELVEKLRQLDERRETILKTIEEQGKLTSELKQQILGADTATRLEDLYAPYKPKRRTRASIARERGLQPLADLILAQPRQTDSFKALAQPYLSEEVPDADSAWAGAQDIVAEAISDHPEVRRIVREKAMQWGSLKSEKIEEAPDERRVYELYYAYEARIDRLRPHQVLALNRGEDEKVLRVKIEVPERDWYGAIEIYFRPDPRSPLREQLVLAIADSAERLLLPAIERDVRNTLTEAAGKHAIDVFAANLKALLSQPPLAGHTVLGLDPGFRTGCKVAIVDPTGRLLATDTIYPHEPQKRWEASLETLARLVLHHRVTLISIGNGTASRETEMLAADLIRRIDSLPPEKKHYLSPLRYLITNEAGASVYSASPLARAELPDLDVSLRGAASIARRVQDPLAELVKIDPKSIGVGLYQHDVDQKELTQALEGVVESVVNAVGVDANTASPALLRSVAGIGPKLAENIVSHRNDNGPFKDRQGLRRVPGLGPKAFEQSAGFLRIREGANPLDASAIHPESYAAASALLQQAGISLQVSLEQRKEALDALLAKKSVETLAEELGIGVPTAMDILEQLVRPARDPREDLPAPILRSDVLKMEDLVPGMRLKGTVRNVVDFGLFVDIGVKQDGLLHRSKLPPNHSLKVGDVIEVEILSVEVERGRISLKLVGGS